MKTILLTLALLLPVQAQENAGRVTKLIEVKYVDMMKLRSLIGVFTGKNTRVEFDTSGAARYVAVAGSSEDVEVVERFIQKLDVPPAQEKNIELTVYMLLGQHAGEGGEKLPAELAGIAKQLQATFGIKDLRLLETYAGRVRAGKGTEASGILSMPMNAPPAVYQLKIFRCSIIEDGKTRTIRLDDVRFGARVPYAMASTSKQEWQFLDTGINTDINVREGQKIVVGKTSISAKDSLFFVVTAKVVD